MSVPDLLNIRGGTQKYILKEAVEDLPPEDIIYRKKWDFPRRCTNGSETRVRNG